MNKSLISSGEAAKILKLTVRHVGLLCRQKILKAEKIGRNYIIELESVKTYKKNKK